MNGLFKDKDFLCIVALLCVMGGGGGGGGGRYIKSTKVATSENKI